MGVIILEYCDDMLILIYFRMLSDKYKCMDTPIPIHLDLNIIVQMHCRIFTVYPWMQEIDIISNTLSDMEEAKDERPVHLTGFGSF